jgi:hypothetical protein
MPSYLDIFYSFKNLKIAKSGLFSCYDDASFIISSLSVIDLWTF